MSKDEIEEWIKTIGEEWEEGRLSDGLSYSCRRLSCWFYTREEAIQAWLRHPFDSDIQS